MKEKMMVKRFVRVSLLVGAVVVVAVPSREVAAGCCVAYDYRHATSEAERVITQIGLRLEQVQMAIVEALRLATGQITSNIKAQTAAYERLMSAQTDQQYSLERKGRRAEAIVRRESAPSACMQLTGSSEGAAADVVSATVASQMQAVNTAWRMGKPGTPSAAGTGAALQHSLRVHQFYRCPDGRVWNLQLDGTSNCDADVRAETLFSAPVLDQPRLEATQAFLRNAIDPVPDGPMPKAVETPEAALLLSKNSRMSLASQLPADAVGRRSPSLPLGAWARSMGQAIPNMPPDLARDVDGKISWMQWMEILSTHRMLSPTWKTDLQEGAPEAAMREVALMLAELLYLQWHQFKMAERNGLVDSADLALATTSQMKGTTSPEAIVPKISADH